MKKEKTQNKAKKKWVTFSNKKRRIIVANILGAIFVYILYCLLGHHLLTEAYFERSIPLLNNVFDGRQTYPLSYYLKKADGMVIKLVLAILLLSFLPFAKSSLSVFYQYRLAVNKKCTGMMVSLPWVIVSVFSVLFITALPFFWVSIPPLIDYPFHLARVFILSHWTQSPALQEWYNVSSFLIPNLGMDILCTSLANLMPIYVAGRVFILAIFALTISGGIFLNRSLYGHYSLWPLILSLFLFNWILLLGFLNYLLGVGFLLWAIGGWILVSDRTAWLRLLYGTAVTVILFFCHLSALGLFAIIVAGYELQRSMVTIRISRLKALSDLLIGASTFIAPLILFTQSTTAGEVTRRVLYYKPVLSSKLTALINTLMFGFKLFDILTFVALGFLVIIVVFLGKLRFANQFYLPIFLLIATYFLLPYYLLGVTFVDTRLPIAIFFVLISLSQLKLKNKQWHYTVLIIMAACLLCRSVILSHNWYRNDRTIQQVANTLRQVSPYSIVFTASEKNFPDFYNNRIQQPPLWHLASLATIDQVAFVPQIWAKASEQPIVTKKRYQAIKAFQGNDPILIKKSDSLEKIIGQIQSVLEHSGMKETPAYLLVLDPRHEYQAITQRYKIVENGPRFSLLSLNID